MEQGDPEPTAVAVDELERWAHSRALPDVDDKFDEGWEALRAQLLRWVQELRELET